MSVSLILTWHAKVTFINLGILMSVINLCLVKI